MRSIETATMNAISEFELFFEQKLNNDNGEMNFHKVRVGCRLKQQLCFDYYSLSLVVFQVYIYYSLYDLNITFAFVGAARLLKMWLMECRHCWK